MRNLVCCCCGGDAGKWEQHWNRDTGFGMCAPCIQGLKERGTHESEIADLYGREGVNWGETQPASRSVFSSNPFEEE